MAQRPLLVYEIADEVRALGTQHRDPALHAIADRLERYGGRLQESVTGIRCGDESDYLGQQEQRRRARKE